MIRLILIFMAMFALAGCSDSDSSSPVDTSAKMNPLAQDDDDKALHDDELLVDGANAARYPTVAGHGILWKPVSDSNGKLAVLLARSYGNPRVDIFDRRGRFIESLRFYYYSNPNRATYRGNRAGRNYGSPCYVRIAGRYVFRVPDSSRRYE